VDNRRLLTATVPSALVLLIWGRYMQPPPVQPPADGPSVTESAPAGDRDAGRGTGNPATTGNPANDGTPGAGETTSEAAPGLAAEAEVVSLIDFGSSEVVGDREQVVRVETEVAFVEWSNRGAQLLSYRLKRQLNDQGEPLNLVRARGNDLYPFALMGGDGGAGPVAKLTTVRWQ